MCIIHAEFLSGVLKVRGMAHAAKSQILLVDEEKIPAKSVILLKGVVNSFRGMTSRTVLCTHVGAHQGLTLVRAFAPCYASTLLNPGGA